MIELADQKLLRLLCLLTLCDVARSTEPFDDLPCCTEQRNCARVGPAQRAIKANYRMLEFEGALARYGFANGPHHASVVVGMNVLLKPALARALGISDKILASEIAHLAPVGAHAINDVRACRDIGAVTLLARASRLGSFVAEPGHFQVCLDARQQLAAAERLDQIIVGTRLQTLHAALFAGPS